MPGIIGSSAILSGSLIPAIHQPVRLDYFKWPDSWEMRIVARSSLSVVIGVSFLAVGRRPRRARGGYRTAPCGSKAVRPLFVEAPA